MSEEVLIYQSEEEGEDGVFRPVIHIHIPEQPAPVVHVHVPEQGPPNVTVQNTTEPVVEVKPVIPPAVVNVQPAKGKRIIKVNRGEDGNMYSAEINDG